MRHEPSPYTPAAFPLIGLVAGLAAGTHLQNPWTAVAGMVLVAFGHVRVARVSLFVALGIVLALHVRSRELHEDAVFRGIEPERFVTIEAPLDRGWTSRDDSFLLVAPRFVANGLPFDARIAIYARFEPRKIAMESTVRAEGFLRRNERGEYSLSVKSPELLSYTGKLPAWHPAAWNRVLAIRLEREAARYPDEVALAEALLLGRGERLSPEMKESFRGGGTYHLLVFSGLQIAFAAGLLAGLLRWLHAPRASDLLLLAFSAIAPLFIGPSASVSRAAIGIGLYAVSRLLKRPTSLQNLWCVAALVRLIVEPRDLMDASFHLTYAGAGALLFIGSELGKPKWLAFLAATEIAITPLTLFHFHQYALGGAVLTLALSPVIFAMLIVSALACAFPQLLPAIGVLHRVCTALNAFGFSGWFAAPPLPALLVGAFAALLALACLRGRARSVAIALVLLIPSTAAVVRSLSRHSVDAPTVTFFDVGQGDAIAVRSGSHVVLIDGGRGRQILPLLADSGIRTLDAVVLSHAHPDHCEGLAPVIAQMHVRQILLSPRRLRGDCAADILEAARISRTPIRFVSDGEVLELGGMCFVASVAERTLRRAPENNASIVLRYRAGGRTFLFTGDIEREAELYLEDHDLRADVLKVAHHGSRSSTSERLLDAVAPRLAVISCGRHNLFGHPHQPVLDALASRGVRTWRTDRDGTIDVEARDGHLYVRSRLD